MISLRVTPEQLVDIISDQRQRLDEHQREDGCALDCQITDPIVLALSRHLEPCLCSDETKEHRAFIQYLEHRFNKCSPNEYRAYLDRSAQWGKLKKLKGAEK